MNKNKKVICHDINGEKIEVDSDKLMFRPSVYGVLIEGDKVLLSKQWDGYDLPGGGMKMSETIIETLVREFFEETGLKVEPIIIVHAETDFFNPAHSKKYERQYWNCQLMYFLVRRIGGELSTENFDEDEKNYAHMPEWIEIDEIRGKKFYNGIDSVALIKKAFNILKNENRK